MSKAVIDGVEWDEDVPTNFQLKTIVEDWREIDWKQVERRVYKLQKRIYRASSRGDVKRETFTSGFEDESGRRLPGLV